MDIQSHWLWRLSALQWLQAADNELASAKERQASRRACVSHCRRAAGMALNAVLVHEDAGQHDRHCEAKWGRSYMDHLRSMRGNTSPLPPSAAASAEALLAISPVAAGNIVQIRTPGADAQNEALRHTRNLLALCRSFVTEDAAP